ncbi:MAG: 3-dehydro-L-gulonate 2-dehydrogenase [Ferruginibacter sp.]|nr:3-dehydro-L-gulonate 2-dehydrogenase [Chitinophagaceae bacterium]
MHIPADEMTAVFERILIRQGFQKDKARLCAEVFTSNSVDGVSTHGVNRFPRFITYVQKGYIKIDAAPSLEHKAGGIEQWNGNLGPGILNALHATTTATKLSDEFGIGCVALSNTNHWMRGGTYGWQAAKAGYVFIGWTNTIANMPAWGASDARLGNNPLVMAVPYKEEAIVLDMATSQFSFGAMEMAVLENKNLSQPGGYDSTGKLTTNPSAILETRRSIPVGYWKGAGLSLLLDLLATILSGGLSTHEITGKKVEHRVSQVFIAISLRKLQNYKSLEAVIAGIIDDYHRSVPVDEESRIIYPGERVMEQRKKNRAEGIPVNKKLWDDILLL